MRGGFVSRHHTPSCPKCHGSGWWQYDHNHAQPCPLCCKHDQGVWLLTHHYNNAGRWCCSAGCGKTWAGIVDYKRERGNV